MAIVKVVTDMLSKVTLETALDADLQDSMMQVFGILVEYEEIWARSAPSLTRQRLKTLKQLIQRLVHPKIKICMATRIAIAVEQENLAWQQVLYLIRLPKGYRSPDQNVDVKQKVIDDRNLLKNRFMDLLDASKSQMKDNNFIAELKKTCEELKIKWTEDSAHWTAVLEEVKKKVEDSKVEEDLDGDLKPAETVKST